MVHCFLQPSMIIVSELSYFEDSSCIHHPVNAVFIAFIHSSTEWERHTCKQILFVLGDKILSGAMILWGMEFTVAVHLWSLIEVWKSLKLWK